MKRVLFFVLFIVGVEASAQVQTWTLPQRVKDSLSTKIWLEWLHSRDTTKAWVYREISGDRFRVTERVRSLGRSEGDIYTGLEAISKGADSILAYIHVAPSKLVSIGGLVGFYSPTGTLSAYIDENGTLTTYPFGSSSKAISLYNDADSLAYFWVHRGGTGGRQLRFEMAVTGSGTAADAAHGRLVAYPYGQLFKAASVDVASRGMIVMGVGYNQFVGTSPSATAYLVDTTQHEWAINIGQAPTYKMFLRAGGLTLLDSVTAAHFKGNGSGLTNLTMPDGLPDSLVIGGHSPFPGQLIYVQSSATSSIMAKSTGAGAGLTAISTAAGADLIADAPADQQAFARFKAVGVSKFLMGKDASNNFVIYDVANVNHPFEVYSYAGGAHTGDIQISADQQMNVIIGPTSALANSATDGFLYIPSMGGGPTGVPTSYPGKVAMVYQTGGDVLWIYSGGVWYNH